MKKILYISRHSLTREQMDYIVDKIGEVELTKVSMTVNDPKHVARMMKDGGFDELIVVLPLGVVQGLCSHGLSPIRVHGSGVDGTWKHDHFERVKSVSVESIWW